MNSVPGVDLSLGSRHEHVVDDADGLQKQLSVINLTRVAKKKLNKINVT
jgi:hypothetical protein